MSNMLAFRKSIHLRPTREEIMKTLLSLTMVLAFFVAIPQCFGQDADQSPAQLFTEQQLVLMFNLAMAPPPSCHQTVCNPAVKTFLDDPANDCARGNAGKACRADMKNAARECRLECTIECHATELLLECEEESGVCSADGSFDCTPSREP